MGTFNLKIATGSTQFGGPAIWFVDGGLTGADILNTANDGNDTGVQDLLDGGGDGTYTLRCYCDTSNVVLDGGAPISFGSIPNGFRALSCQGNMRIGLSQTDFTTVRVTNQWFFQNFAVGAAFNVGPASFLGYITGALIAGTPPSFLRLFGVGFGLNIVVSWSSAPVGHQTGYWKIDFLEINGTYDIIPLTWTLTPTAVNPGDIVTITPTGVTPLSLTGLVPVIQYIDNNNVVQSVSPVITQTSPVMTLIVPVLPNINPVKPISVVATGTQFSGTVLLGILTLIIANGSGIYVVTPGKTADTLYVNSTVNNTTADVKIQDPFIKTASLP